MIKIYIVRHGQCEGNLKGVVMGQIDTPLTDDGIKNAKNKAISKYLEQNPL